MAKTVNFVMFFTPMKKKSFKMINCVSYIFYLIKENTYFTHEGVTSDCDWRLQNLLLRPLRTGLLERKVKGSAGLLPLSREAPPTQTSFLLHGFAKRKLSVN